MKNEKNICETLVRGKKKFLVSITTPEKKRIKRYFDAKADAREWLANYKKSIGVDLSDLAQLSQNQLADIRLALEKLPKGYSLSQCVDIVASRFVVKRSLEDCVNDFLTLKEASPLSEKYSELIPLRLKKILALNSFEEATAPAILNFVNNITVKCKKGNTPRKIAPKTKKHYLAIYREFFDWCKTRQYILSSPFEQVHDSEMPKIILKNPDVPSISEVEVFIRHVERVAPQFVSILALVAFGGIRKEEAARLEKKDFDFENKRILISSEKSKTRQNWLQEDMPDNVWVWLEKFPPNPQWASFNKDVYDTLNKDKLMIRNGLRHAFATYHLSLYRNAPRTSLLLRHRNPNMLWQTYLAGLISKEEAKTYFEILPKM